MLLETSSYNHTMCVTNCWTSPICTREQWSLQGFLHPLMILSPVTSDPVRAEIHERNSHTCSESRSDLLCEASTWVMLLMLPHTPSRQLWLVILSCSRKNELDSDKNTIKPTVCLPKGKIWLLNWSVLLRLVIKSTWGKLFIIRTEGFGSFVGWMRSSTCW